MIVVTASEMQAMDRKTIEEYGIPGRVLMENAGRGATRTFLERIYRNRDGRVGVMAGRGNNGGDGFVMARYLAQKGVPVTVFLLAREEQVQGDAAANLHLLADLNVVLHELPDPESFQKSRSTMAHVGYWIDAILGTGLKSEVKGYFKQVIDFINAAGRPVMAVDIPSGLNADNGQICGVSIRAAATATFAFPKIGHLVYPGAGLCGAVDVIDIGIPPFIAGAVRPRQRLITPGRVREVLDRRPAETHKGRTGHALVVAGSSGKTGAAWMNADAALKAGAGLVTLAVPASLQAVSPHHVVEVMTLPLDDQDAGRFDESMSRDLLEAVRGRTCLAIGPGMGTHPSTGALIWFLVENAQVPMVIDADGLNLMAPEIKRLKACKSPVVLTPHPGEMARLTGLTVPEIQKNRIEAARGLAADLGAHVVLKGARTVVADPDGLAWINPSGNPGMASAGMGDILTGIIAGLLAQGRRAGDAARAGVYLHGLAADILASEAPWGFLASEVAQAVPHAIGQVLDNPPALPIHLPLL
ncbi:MAG: NAD(P)H-hydrate dehydratase [Desulfosarcinaceae bacterium]